jgi:hypothetical protein
MGDVDDEIKKEVKSNNIKLNTLLHFVLY